MPERDLLLKTHFPQFHEQNDSAMDRVKEQIKLVKLDARQPVFYPGDPCENYLLMLEGCIRIQLISENGREISLYRVKPGDSCVLTTSCLLSGQCYPAEAYTEVDVRAFLLSAADFQQALGQSDFFRNFVFSNLAQRLTGVITRMDDVVCSSIDTRLARFLLEADNNTLSVTHQALATELGSAREVISRHLKHFESREWVKLGRGTIELLDRAAIQKLACLQ